MTTTLLRQQLASMIRKPNAHPTLNEIVDGFPSEHYGTIPDGFAHSAWQLIEHMRIDIDDTIEYTMSSDFTMKKIPDDFWPENPAPKDEAEWNQCVAEFNQGIERLIALVEDESIDLFAIQVEGRKQNLFQCALLVIKHNSYHLGQLMQLRRRVERID